MSHNILQKASKQAVVALFAMAISAASAVQAAPVALKHSPQTDLSVTQPVGSMGRLLLPQGMLKVRGQVVEVQAVPEWLFDRHTVLKGKLLQATIRSGEAAANPNTSLDALVYFNDGDWLKELYRGKRTRESITLKSGEIVSGNVRSVGEEALNIEIIPGTIKKIELGDIVGVDSPYAYRINVALANVKIAPDSQDLAADGGAVQFTPATIINGKFGNQLAKNKTAILPASNLPGTEGGITRNKIASMVAADTINTLAPLIAIPIVVPLGERSAIRGLNSYQQADFINSVLDLPPTPSAIARF
ncbi:MAG: hypothetical protein IPL73_14335 [Candidatus Obscuribacter sp.]|nr:hypothetical protein [Candidatus Obscuribacter sp.]